LHQKIRNFQKLRQKYWIFLKFQKKILNLCQTIEFLDLKTQIFKKKKLLWQKYSYLKILPQILKFEIATKRKITFKFQKMCVELKMLIEKHFWGCRK
jgi:hypothetical protein